MKNVITVFVIFTTILSSKLLFAQSNWEVYTTSNSGICSDTVTSIFIDNKNVFWFGTISGVSKFDGNNWTNYTNAPFTEYNEIRAIKKLNGSYYFGTLSGLIKFDGNSWSSVPAFSSYMITCMDTDDVGNLWIGTDGHGILKYDGINIVAYDTNTAFPSYNRINDIKVDRNGNIWAAMSNYQYQVMGIAEYSYFRWDYFIPQNIYSITEDKNGNLWFGTDSLELIKFDGSNWNRYYLGNLSSSNYISSLTSDFNGNIWAGLGFSAGDKGLIEFDGNNKITKYTQTEGFQSDRAVNDLLADINGNIWAGSWDGLIELNNEPVFNITNGIDSLRSLRAAILQWDYQFQNKVKIEFSIYGNWFLVADSVSAPDNTFNWTVPVVAPSNNTCKVRISDVSNASIYIESPSFVIYPKIETPYFTPNGGTKNNGTYISILCPTKDADIYYTLDGSKPDVNATKYTGPFYINKNIVLKARAFKLDWIESDLKSAEYKMKVAPVVINPSGAYYTDSLRVVLSTITDSATIYYSLNGYPTRKSPVYTSPMYIKSHWLNAIAFRDNFDSSEVAQAGYVYNPAPITAVINTDSIWLDLDHNGYEERIVDATKSSTINGSISGYWWTVNGDSAAVVPKPKIKLKTGTNKITLIVRNTSHEEAQTSIYINVYASRLKTSGAINSAPAQVDNNTFFVTSTDDKVYQFDSTGSVKWNILTGGAIQSTTCISDQNNIYVGSTDTRLYSFDQNGVPKWDKSLGGIINSSPSAGKDGVVYVGISTGRLFALDESGNVIWYVQTGGAIISSPAVSLNGNLYVGSCDKKLYSISKDGNLNWTFASGDTILSSPAIGNDSSIIFGSNDGYIYKLNPSGSKIWSYYSGGKIISSPIIIDGGQIIFGNSNGEIVCIDKDGSVLWRYYTSSPVYGTAAISDNGQILIGDESGTLRSLDKQGNLLWDFKTNSAIESPILITDRNLAMFGNLNGDVYVLQINSDGSAKIDQANYEWSTFKGNNKRTGNKIDALTDIKNENSNTVKEYKLSQNYPNPFNPSTIINYEVPKSGLVTIKIYDVLGREIETLVNEEKSPGRYKVKFDGSNLTSGLYFYRITSGNFSETKKMLLLK